MIAIILDNSESMEEKLASFEIKIKSLKKALSTLGKKKQNF